MKNSTKICYSVIPVIHADGSRSALAYEWEITTTHSTTLKMPCLFVHADAPIEWDDILGANITTNDAVISHMPHFMWMWNDDTQPLLEMISRAISTYYRVDQTDIVGLKRNSDVTGVFNQALMTDQMTSGFTYEIFHNSDYNPACGACVHSATTVHTILGDWLKQAIFVEQDWEEVPYFEITDKKKIVILKPSDKPQVQRILLWFVENFEETIRMASIDRIVFQDYDTKVCYEHIITYSTPTERL